MSSLERMLSVLDAFRPEAPLHSSEELLQLAGASRATLYRYLTTLQHAGLITAVANGNYTLGPRIAELDRQVRLCDPLYQAGGPVLRALTQQTRHASLLCALYADRVMCIRDERSDDGPRELFNRGQSRPLFTAAASKIIMAFLAPHQLRRLHRNNPAAIARAGLGEDWDAFRAALRVIRAAGYAYTVGEFNPGIAGIAAPVFNSGKAILGSVGLAMAARHVTPETLPGFAEQVTRAAEQITAVLRASPAALGRAPRAVGRANALETEKEQA